ncbi:MAG: glycosyltransferase family 39 protein [Lentisphaerae bacterium]|nr:glycosyltransferase family 39 protein [Lentisphaerota bacterium]
MPFKEKHKFVPEMCLVAFLLTMHFFLAFTSLIQESATFDEPVHITGGLCYWKFDDYRINPENGNFPQRLAAIPLLFETPMNAAYTKSPSIEVNEWLTAYDFLYKKGNDPDRIFMLGKTMIVLLSLVLGLAVYLWSRKLFGPGPAAFSLILYAFCPTVLAHARLVTSDIAATLGFIASSWAIWHMLQKITVPRLLLSSLCLSLLFISKMSAPMIIPMYLIMIAVKIRECPELELVLPGHRILKLKTQASQLLAFIFAGIINVIVIAFFIWMSFGFRYSMMNDDTGKRVIMEENWQNILKDSGISGKVVDFSRQHRLLPEAYLFGFQFVLKNSAYRYAYLNGEHKLTGWWYFFPYTCLIKTPLPIIGIFILATFLAIRRLKVLPSAEALAKLKPFTPLFVLIAVYGIFAVTSKMNIGHRHVLVLYPAAFILAGAVIPLLKKSSPYLRASLVFLLLWFLAESLAIWPHYLAYFNQIAGGPKNGYRHLVDSSLDWGQDLKGLGKWLKSKGLLNQNKTDIYVSYFGIASIDYYARGVKKLPSYHEQESNVPFELKGGVYCISATMLHLVYLPDLLGMKDLNSGLFDDNIYKEVEAEIKPFLAVMNAAFITSSVLRNSQNILRCASLTTI